MPTRLEFSLNLNFAYLCECLSLRDPFANMCNYQKSNILLHLTRQSILDSVCPTMYAQRPESDLKPNERSDGRTEIVTPLAGRSQQLYEITHAVHIIALTEFNYYNIP